MIPDYITKKDIRYAIVGKDEQEVSITVTFWAEGYTPLATYNITLPVTVDNKIPTGKVLSAYIMGHAPVEYLNKEIHRYKQGVLVDFTEIDRLIAEGKGKVPTIE